MSFDRADVSPHGHREPRDEVHHRVRAIDLTSGAALSLLVVNVSPHGMMARCDVPLATGERLRIIIPTAGIRVAEVRWALGGRIGCQFDQPITLGAYVSALAAMR